MKDRKTADHHSSSVSVSQSNTSTLSRSPSPSPPAARRRSAMRSTASTGASSGSLKKGKDLDETLSMKTEAAKQSSRSRKSAGDDVSAQAGERAKAPSSHRRPTPHPAFADSGSSDEESNTTTSAERTGSAKTTKRHKDTPWRGSKSDSSGTSLGSRKNSKGSVTFADLSVDEVTSDDEMPSSQIRRQLKAPTFNGTGNFETFLAQFENCARFNRWNSLEQLAHLRNSLSEAAGQILWDSGPEVTNSLSRLTKLLKERFGGAAQSDRYRMELRSRIRQPRETLSDLHRDIKRLIALGYPELDAAAREVIAVDRLLDSLGDPDLALKIRERTPSTLDEALKAGLRQEVWNKDTTRRPPDAAPPKAVRVASEDLLQTVSQKLDQLQKQIDQANRRQIKPIVVTTVERMPANSTFTPPAPKQATAPANTPVTAPIPESTAATPTKPLPAKFTPKPY
ncbi:MAG TPA: hypothetical protein VLS45_04905, partial [Methylomicrobium sp.]|nr:hypothetical protein [Methylomicrobium sp.]